MKKLSLTSLLALLIFQVSAQSVLTPSWIKTEISNNGSAEGWGVDIDSDGTIYWAVSNNNLNQGIDIKCYKFDGNGDELWNTPFLFGGNGTQQAYVANLHENNLYIGGRYCTGLVTTCDMLLLKIDKASGDLIWDKTMNFSGDGYDEIDGLEFMPDGIYCGGWAQELQSNIFQSDIGLWKLDYDGNTIWTNYFGQANSAEHQDGHFVVDENNIYAAGLWNGTGGANLYNGHSFLGKFSLSDGSLIDSTLFGYQSNAFLDIENALGMSSDGEFLYITGYTTPESQDGWQIFIAKYDKDLNQIWYTDWGGSGSESARAITVDNNQIYIGGLTESTELMTGGGDRDAVLLKLDLDGNLMEYFTWGNNKKNSILDLQKQNNKIYLTGMSEFDSMGINREAFLLTIDNLSTSSNTAINPNGKSFSVSPTPSTGNIKIKLDDPTVKNAVVRVIDLNGQTILTKAINNPEFELEIKSSGYFLVNINFGNYSISKKILISRE